MGRQTGAGPSPAPQPAISSSPDEEMKQYLKMLFALADEDSNGILDKFEFAKLLKASGFNFSPQQVMKVMKAADTNQDNKIDYGEVMHLDRQRD